MQNQVKKSLVVLVAAFCGLVLGLAIAANFELVPFGRAENPNPTQSAVGGTAVQPSSDLESTSRAFVAIAKRVTPTVVSITSEKVVKVRNPLADFFRQDDFFRRFFQDRGREREYRQQGLGSGVIVSEEGYILTNYHVIKEADEVDVVYDGKKYDAEIVGTDPATDLAVVKIEKKGLPAITLGDSDKLEVGEWVLAIGSPFDLRLEHTVTSGIISAKGRSLNLSRDLTYQDFIQTDAAINPGNSGGALVNIRGELIGINTAIYAGNMGGNIGIGFAIPINLAKRVMDDLITHGRVVRGYLGVYIETPDEEMSEALNLKDTKGAVIVEVQEGTPADRAGLKKLDVVIAVDGQKVEDQYDLTNIIGSYSPGSEIELKIIRDGKVKKVRVVLDERRDAAVAGRRETKSDVLDKLGLELTTLTPGMAKRYGVESTEGALVLEVRSGSVADEKGMRAGDLIKEVNRVKVDSAEDVRRILNKASREEIVLFQIQRGSRNRFVAMRLPE